MNIFLALHENTDVGSWKIFLQIWDLHTLIWKSLLFIKGKIYSKFQMEVVNMSFPCYPLETFETWEIEEDLAPAENKHLVNWGIYLMYQQSK